MATQDGSKYPCIEDGLIFCFDPKNRNCWGGGNTTGYNISNSSTSSFFNFSENSTSGLSGGVEEEGYFSFDGTDEYLRFEDTNKSLNISGSTQLTVTWWCWKHDTIATNNWTGGVSATYDNNMDTGWAFTTLSNNKTSFWVNLYNGTGDGGEAYINDCRTVMPNETWGSFTGVYDGTNVSIYQQGLLVGVQDTCTAQIKPHDPYKKQYIQIARTNWGYASGYWWNHKVGPVMIWNRALSATEILQNHNRLKSRFGL